MPELPDVEVFKQYADATSLHQEIEKTEARDEKVFETSPKKVQRALKGKKLEETKRIGNVYSDEILFQSGIHPKAKVQSLSEAQVETLYEKMRSVLKTTIEKGAQPDQLPDHFLLRHREEGVGCPGGRGKVEKIKVSGRSGYCCPEQQKL